MKQTTPLEAVRRLRILDPHSDVRNIFSKTGYHKGKQNKLIEN